MSRFEALLDAFFYRPDEDVGGLLDFAAGSDDLAQPLLEEEPVEYLAFRLEAECYAVPILAVREICKVPLLTEIPRAEPQLLGVMNLRGELLPVYDVKLRLRLADVPPLVAGPDAGLPPRASRILVLKTEDGPAGVWVDSVAGVVRLKPSMVELSPAGLRGDRDCVAGLGRKGSQLYILLDPEQALAP
ncbi:purine-binding chemotaxis protein CheW [Corallococcus exiguus]|uniref:chemotaxis protein CheW n=1 Tax=Corallococcus TaxID=83461 RepID=UPI000EA03AF1|nr:MULTISPECIES: chemotaxis protein CheW [unclassified Corallococcus]NNB96931.1 purine-binding chemotaxis protein CheW [Corallococcus exiguus]NNC04199.1 purine-binding chemotaxis protein CheW [Corallococcus exiguus]NNC17256.1 purine-binding chemotaxis protein CheW [Corallococcus exiguus]NPC46446.1 purine-binding chemotaxis protein CheW [Corallococcus exiguus]NRD52699.1 purine-binding chemotaxis protein CheW [Corallococcus exiguus]